MKKQKKIICPLVKGIKKKEKEKGNLHERERALVLVGLTWNETGSEVLLFCFL
jgi:hypothetical protein